MAEKISEQWLHYLWQYQKYAPEALCTDTGQTLQIIKPGYLNKNAGPDFLEAKIIIDGITWAGNIEIHHRASHWQRHNHQHNAAYNNVILHVVWQNDGPIYTQDGQTIATLSLENRVPKQLHSKYQQLMEGRQALACQNSFESVPHFTKLLMLERLLIERLETKADRVLGQLAQYNADWEQTCYATIAEAMGFGLNSEAMARLADEMPLKTLLKQDQLQHIMALLLGQANLLGPVKNEILEKDFLFFKEKYSLNSSISTSTWKYLRLRPSNFAHVRIGQLAQMLARERQIFAKILNAQNLDDLHAVFKADKFGKSSINLLIINAVAPLLVAYSKARDMPQLQDLAIEYLDNMQPENNRIIRLWASVGLQLQQASHSQAAIQWYKNYCLPKHCLSCGVAHYLLQNTKV
jgi:hypothetical protein